MLVLLGVISVQPVMAKTNFMTTDVPVADYSKQALQTSLQEALSQVLVKVSGNPSVMTLPQVQNELQHINSMVSAYSYDNNLATDGKPGLSLKVAFNDHSIKRLLRSAGQPVWSADRPTTLVWLQVQHQNGDVDMIAPSGVADSPLASALNQDAQARGLTLMFPMFDLEDQSNMGSERRGQGLNVSQIQQASSRYHVMSMLAGVVHEVGGHWQADWLYILDGAPIRWQDEADSPQALAAQAVNELAGSMISQLAMASPEQSEATVILHVRGIDDLSQYAMVQDYLQGLNPVTKVSLETVDPDELVLRVRFQGQLNELKRSIQSGHRMNPSSSDWLQQDDSPTLAYHWLGGVG